MSAFDSGWAVLKASEDASGRDGTGYPTWQHERIRAFGDALFPKIHGQRTIRVPYQVKGPHDLIGGGIFGIRGGTHETVPFAAGASPDFAEGGEMGEFEVNFLGISPKEDRALIEDEMEFYGGAPIGHYSVQSRTVPDYPPNSPSQVMQDTSIGDESTIEDAKQMVIYALERQFPGFIERVASGEIDIDDYMNYFRVID